MNSKLVPWTGGDTGHFLGPLPTNVTYVFDAWRDDKGIFRPRQLGNGKYAKVYLGWQQNDGGDVMPVAIKVPHDYSSFADERLFKQEIQRNKEMSSATGVNICKMLDVLQLGPMIMCGCGKIYRPLCPNKGCGPLLRKADNPKDNHPSLHCESCGYELSAQRIGEQFGDLLRYPAKPCCQDSSEGTILNFVDRQAAVLERLHCRLDDFAGLRRRHLQYIAARFGIKPTADDGKQDTPGWVQEKLQQLRGPWQRNIDELLLRKVALLEKMRLMVQLAEAVAWLHTVKTIVHKDLAPDNIMLCLTDNGEKRGPGQRDAHEATQTPSVSDTWGGEKWATFRDMINDLINHPKYAVRIIDFGLADKNELTQSWYEEEVGAGTIKHPYLSPEAEWRKLRITIPLAIDEQARRFKIPRDLLEKLKVSDIIADLRDPEHNHDLEIIRIEREPQTGAEEPYAYFRGDPPRNLDNQQFELVRRLGEAHDVYSLGALFYYILTEQHDEVSALKALVEHLRDVPCELTPKALRRNGQYLKRRDAIREKFWQDEMMVLILRSMVRGQPESLVQDRTQRGPDPAQRLLYEMKRIFHGLQQEILTEPSGARLDRVFRPSVAVPVGLLLAGLTATAVVSMNRHPSAPPKKEAAMTTPAANVPIPPSAKPPAEKKAPLEVQPLASPPPPPPPQLATRTVAGATTSAPASPPRSSRPTPTRTRDPAPNASQPASLPRTPTLQATPTSPASRGGHAASPAKPTGPGGGQPRPLPPSLPIQRR